MTESNLSSEKKTDLDRYVEAISRHLGYDSAPPEDLRGLMEKLKKQGYSVQGAARHIRTLLDINTL